MSKLQNLIEASKFNITGGDQYLWKCYGDKARYLEMGNSVVYKEEGNSESDESEIVVEVVFDSVNQDVYEAVLHVGKYVFRWLNSDFEESYKNECYQRNVDPRLAYENIFYSDCEVFEDFVDKVQDSFIKGFCDTTILVQIDLSEENMVLFNSLELSEENFNLEEFIIKAIKEKLDEISKCYKNIWSELISDLSAEGIVLSMSDKMMPISKDNVPGIKSWLKGLDMKNIDLEYYDKQTERGIESFLSVESSTANLMDSFTYSYICMY